MRDARSSRSTLCAGLAPEAPVPTQRQAPPLVRGGLVSTVSSSSQTHRLPGSGSQLANSTPTAHAFRFVDPRRRPRSASTTHALGRRRGPARRNKTHLPLSPIDMRPPVVSRSRRAGRRRWRPASRPSLLRDLRRGWLAAELEPLLSCCLDNGTRSVALVHESRSLDANAARARPVASTPISNCLPSSKTSASVYVEYRPTD